MKPTYELLLKGACTWREKHKGVEIILSFHSCTEYNKSGTWCYYLLIPKDMYPHRWDDFKCKRVDGYERNGIAFDHVDFHGGITFSKNQKYYDPFRKEYKYSVKVGCDYAHLWDEEQGYPDDYASVLYDAKNSAEQFLNINSDYLFKSGYSHRWGEREDFYEAVNGCLVHKDDAIPDNWLPWKPKTKELKDN